MTAPSTQLEREIAKQDRRTKVKDLDKHRTEAAERYRTALEKLAKDRDSQAFVNDPIMPGDLVMREPLNRKSKLHPRWDGPLVVLASTDKDAYQLATANGYRLAAISSQWQPVNNVDTLKPLYVVKPFQKPENNLLENLSSRDFDVTRSTAP